MAVLNAMLSGGVRRPRDFYPTPISATKALTRFIQSWKSDLIWEAACGDGAISVELEKNGFNTISSDIFDYGYGTIDNFFQCQPKSNCIVTNPPFQFAETFIRRALENKTERMALLLKSNYWSAAKRKRLFESWRPAMILALTWRLDFTGAGAPHTDCHWIIWDGKSTITQFEVIGK